MGDILAIDVGTSILKLGVFTSELQKKCEASQGYEINLYDQGKADIEPEKWWIALRGCCDQIADALTDVRVVSFSVTTPGLVPMQEDGTALGPAILFLDARSHEQAREIRKTVGEGKFLQSTCNLPVSGGSSLCSILWIRDNQPEIWKATYKFGHCNTYMVKRFTGNWAIDPSTVSITGLYNTSLHDLTWNTEILATAGISESRLPPLMHSYQVAGFVQPTVAQELHLQKDCAVLCGGNDAVLAALSGDTVEPGDIGYIAGTCEITYVCMDHSVSSPNFNIRCHVIPDRWMTFFVLNTGGKSLEWFHSVFCHEMSLSQFYETYVPDVLSRFLGSDVIESVDANLPEYLPYLQGSRYSLERLTAGFSGLSLETDRDQMLLALIKGNALYQGRHLEEVAQLTRLSRKVVTSGGMAKIRHFLEAKRRWSGNLDYEFRDQSSLRGAAMLGQFYQEKRFL